MDDNGILRAPDEIIAHAFYDAHERLASEFGWETAATITGVDWHDLSLHHRLHLRAVVISLLGQGFILPGNETRRRLGHRE